MGLLAFLAGLGFARTGWLISYELVISFVTLFLVSIVRLRWMALVGTVLLGFSLGWLRGQIFMPNAGLIRQVVGQKVVAQVRATGDVFYDNRGQVSFEADDLVIVEPSEEEVPGRLVISGFGASNVFKGDVVQVEGKLYARRGSKQLGMSYAQMEVLEHHPNVVDDVRRKFSAGLATAVPEPAASLGLGLLIGQRSNLPEDVTLALSAVGLTHIVAVSGYNLTIIMRGVKRLLKNRSKYQITALSLVLIGVFVLATGFSASIVRAALVSGLSILAWHYGRTFKPLLLLALVACSTAGWNPFFIWNDIGWYLSFLAFFGVLVVAPALQTRLFGDKQAKLIGSVCLESVSAMIMTLPLIMFVFERVSLVALLANLLVVPLVPLAMLLATIAGIAGMTFSVVSGLVGWPAATLLTAMLDIVQLCAKVPYAQVNRSLGLVGMLVVYSAQLFGTAVMWRKNHTNAKITDMTMEKTA